MSVAVISAEKPIILHSYPTKKVILHESENHEIFVPPSLGYFFFISYRARNCRGTKDSTTRAKLSI